jgi:hypothetical protein
VTSQAASALRAKACAGRIAGAVRPDAFAEALVVGSEGEERRQRGLGAIRLADDAGRTCVPTRTTIAGHPPRTVRGTSASASAGLTRPTGTT